MRGPAIGESDGVAGDRGGFGGRSATAQRRGDRGSVVVEYLGILPLVFVVALVILQGLTAVAVTTAAEDAARAAARAVVRGDGARVAALDSLPAWLDGRIVELDVVDGGPQVTVRIELSVPAAGSLATGGTVSGQATFARD